MHRTRMQTLRSKCINEGNLGQSLGSPINFSSCLFKFTNELLMSLRLRCRQISSIKKFDSTYKFQFNLYKRIIFELKSVGPMQTCMVIGLGVSYRV